MKKGIVRLAIAASLVLVLSGCSFSFSSSNDDEYDSAKVRSANISGGVAVALGSTSSSASSMSTLNYTVANTTNDSIFTVFPDGSIEYAIEFDGDYRPNIEFTAVSPDGYLYVKTQDGWGGLGLYAIKIDTNQVFEARADSDQMDIRTWYWDEGSLRTKPILFSSTGRAYFVVRSWSGNAQSERIASWKPDDPQIRFETAELQNKSIDRFQIDDQGRMYLWGWVQSGSSSSQYLQVFDPRSPRGRYVYYSENNSWVRGYVASGDNVILNGWQVLGNDGIVQIKSSLGTDGELVFAVNPLYNSNTTDWFQPEYSPWYDNWSNQTYHHGLFVRDNGEWIWAAHWRNGDSLDEEKIVKYLSTFYVQDITIDFNDLDRSFTDEELFGAGTWDHWHWPATNVRLKSDSSAPAVTFQQWREDNDFPWLDFGAISDMVVFSDGSLWGIYDSRWWGGGHPTAIIRLLNSDGNRDLKAVKTVSAAGGDVQASMFQLNASDDVFYRYGGTEPGTHRIGMIDASGTFTDVSKNIPSIRFMTIYDFSVADDILYFSGYDGIRMISGRISLDTLEYSTINSTTTITSIDPL